MRPWLIRLRSSYARSQNFSTTTFDSSCKQVGRDLDPMHDLPVAPAPDWLFWKHKKPLHLCRAHDSAVSWCCRSPGMAYAEQEQLLIQPGMAIRLPGRFGEIPLLRARRKLWADFELWADFRSQDIPLLADTVNGLLP